MSYNIERRKNKCAYCVKWCNNKIVKTRDVLIRSQQSVPVPIKAVFNWSVLATLSFIDPFWSFFMPAVTQLFLITKLSCTVQPTNLSIVTFLQSALCVSRVLLWLGATAVESWQNHTHHATKALLTRSVINYSNPCKRCRDNGNKHSAEYKQDQQVCYLIPCLKKIKNTLRNSLM